MCYVSVCVCKIGNSFPGIICHEIRVTGSSFITMYVIVCEKLSSLFNGSGLATLLVKLEQLDIETLYTHGIDMPHFYGVITDGYNRWGFIRRNNYVRHIAKDILCDPLLTHNQHFTINNELSNITLPRFPINPYFERQRITTLRT